MSLKPIEPMSAEEIIAFLKQRIDQLEVQIKKYHDDGTMLDNELGLGSGKILHRQAGSLKMVRSELDRVWHRAQGKYTKMELAAADIQKDWDRIFQEIEEERRK